MSLCRWLFCKNNTIDWDDNDDPIETENEPVYCPDRNGFLQIIKTMQKFSLFSKMVQLSNLRQIMLLA